VDYTRPVQAVIPGVQGRILAALSRTEAELTMRTVARIAGVSANRATAILNRLVQLGLVERRDVGTAALVRLIRDNEASRVVAELATLPDIVPKRLAEMAAIIKPAPASLILFGSFARGQATDESDIDVLVVRPNGVASDDATWTQTVGEWSDMAARMAGNPVNLLVVSEAELPQLAKRKRSVWAGIAREGVTLAGADVRQLGSAA